MMIALMTICKPEIVHRISFIPKLNDVDDDVNAAVIHKINISTSFLNSKVKEFSLFRKKNKWNKLCFLTSLQAR